jgi:hypothetical protein
VFTAPSGEAISFGAQNNGALAHSLIILEAGREVKDHFTGTGKANVY